LNRLLADVEANPHNPKRALIYAKRLVEASTVLASEGGRADVKTTAKNRDRYITDAYKRVKKLAAGGYPEAQFYLADCYGQGQLGLEPDTKEAFSLYQAAAKAGHPQAAYRTAVCCEMGPDEGGGTRKDFPKAVQWYRRAATLGDTAAMFKIGVVLLKGLLGEQKNVAEAINWLKRAAERADKDTPHALHELAGLYDTGNTAPEIRNKIVADDSYALELLERAAALGYKFSQFRLGQAYEYGHLGLDIDNRLSITWYTRAAAQGEHQAELALSGWYLTGAAGILEHNDTEAYLWARKAAVSEPPLAKAMFAMGYFAENGIGCPASMEDAKKWYGRAACESFSLSRFPSSNPSERREHGLITDCFLFFCCLDYKFPKALERIEELKRNPNKGRSNDAAKLSRKDQKRDEAECTVM
jgi:TPR repeat protein